jgi:putative membrane protein
MYWGHRFWGMHVFWWVFWMAVVVAVAVWALSSSRAIASKDSALDELRRRYASGEIDDEEYEHRLAVLEGVSGRAPARPGERPRQAGGGGANG